MSNPVMVVVSLAVLPFVVGVVVTSLVAQPFAVGGRLVLIVAVIAAVLLAWFVLGGLGAFG